MTVKRKLEYYNVIYFITFSCYNWLQLFELAGYDIAYNWFKKLIEKRIGIIGFVIMPNHIHVIFYLPEKAGIVNQIVANGKRFMAYEIVSRLKAKNQNKILRRLKDGVSKSEFRSGKIHKVFNTSFDAKICEAREFVEQKLNYVHHNPVSGKWSIVDDWSKYPHSSAAYYEYGIQCKTPVTHYLDYF